MASSSWVGWMFPQQKNAQQEAHQRKKIVRPGEPEASREDEDSWRHDFRVGDRVEYYSTGYQDWIDAIILEVHSDGELLDLDVKKGIPVERVRFPTHQPSAVHAGADNMSSHLLRSPGMPGTEYGSWTAEGPSGANGNTKDESAMQDSIMDKVNNIIKVQLLRQDRHVRGMLEEERSRYEKLIKDLKQQLSEAVDSAQMNAGIQLVSDAMRRDLSAQRLALTQLGEKVTALSQRVSSVVDSTSLQTRGDSTTSVQLPELEDLKAQMADLRRTTQLAAVETGFLALAAADCTAPEKARLFNTLKMKEEAITGSDSRLKTILNAPLNKDEGAIEFQVRLTRIAAQKLGIAIEAQDDGILRVLSVEDDGVVVTWNRNNPMRSVQAGDLITKVNDAVGNASRLQEELGRAMFSVLTIHRPCAAEQNSRPLSKR